MSSVFWRAFLAIAPSSIAPTASRVCSAWPQVARRAPTTFAPTRKALWIWGATVCRPKNPLCEKCPLANLCRAKKDGAQASLPRKSAKKPRPQKTIGVAVVARADRSGFSILLQKRPARGIWGGLWSPLETAPAPDLTFVRARRLLRAKIKAAGIELRADRRARDLPAIAHEFTHFRIDLLPVLFFAVGGESEGLLWLPRAGIDSAPLSAPRRAPFARA